MLRRVVLERRNDQLFLAIDFAAGQRDAALAFADQNFCEGIGVGEHLKAAIAQERRPSRMSSCRH